MKTIGERLDHDRLLAAAPVDAGPALDRVGELADEGGVVLAAFDRFRG